MRLTFPSNRSERAEVGYTPYPRGTHGTAHEDTPDDASPVGTSPPYYPDTHVDVPRRVQPVRPRPDRGAQHRPGPSAAMRGVATARSPSLSPIAEGSGTPQNRYVTPPMQQYSRPQLSQSVSPDDNVFTGRHGQYLPSSSMDMEWEPTLPIGSYASSAPGPRVSRSPTTPTRHSGPNNGSPQLPFFADE